MIKTIIFDMDGTLIDTEKYYRVCWREALAKFGYDMSDEQALSMRSLGRPFAAAHLKEMFGQGIDYEAVREYRKKLMEDCLKKEGIELKTGALELLAWLRGKGITTAVATATDMERTSRYLAQTGLIQYMDKVVSATMVERGKPSPDIYIYACGQLGAEPSETIAVEDSPNGVMSAYRAGCKVVMVPDQTEADSGLRKLLYAYIPSLLDIKLLFANGAG